MQNVSSQSSGVHKKKKFEIGFKSGRAVSTIIFYLLVLFFLGIYYVPGCSGMCRVPGFIDAQKLCINDLRVLHIKDMNA